MATSGGSYLQMSVTVLRVNTGYFPRNVSEASRIPSAPSRTRLATSVASALVGLGASDAVIIKGWGAYL